MEYEEGNVFTSMCHSVYRGREGSVFPQCHGKVDPPPGRSPFQATPPSDTLNRRSLHILLECILFDCSDTDDPHAVQLDPVHQSLVVWSGGGVRGGGRHLAAHRVQPAVRGRVPGRRARGETRGHRRGHARRQTVHRRLLRVGTTAQF